MAEEVQLGFPLEGLDATPVSAHSIRLELNEILARARAAREVAPWDIETQRYYRASLPEKAKALPQEEAEFIRRQFVLEFDRIEQLLAA